MPRNYIRKTTRQDWSEEAMFTALDAVNKGMPYKTASKQFSVPLMALKRRAKGKNKNAVGVIKALGSKKTIFTLDQEQELVDYIKEMESRMYGLTKQDLLSLAYQLAEKNKIPHPFSKEKEKAGVDWLKGFRKRHPDITLRCPESTSAARARAFNKPVVDRFFTILKDTQDKHSIPPHRIYNIDETSLCTVPTKNTKVFAQTGRKQVARVTSAERGDTTTAVICGSASGNYIPPMLIFRRLRMKIELMDGAPPGSAYACNSSGWMKLEMFEKWFDHFLSHVKPSAEDPVLLILDGHLSHTKNLNVVLKARQNYVIILCLPPHCTHKLQPLDVAVMYPLGIYHNQALEKWMNHNPGRVVTVFQIAKIFAEAYYKAAIPLNIINGFAKCGIYPLNQDVFTDLDYVAAETTEMEMDIDRDDSFDSISILETAPSTLLIQATNQDVSSEFNAGPSSQMVLLTNEAKTTSSSNDRETTSPKIINLISSDIGGQDSEDLQSDMPPSGPVNTLMTSSRTTSCESLQSMALNMVSKLITPPKLTQEIGPVSPSTSDITPVDMPSTSFSKFAPRKIQPLPKIHGKRSNTTRKRKMDTSVLTSTPYKNYLEEETAKKKEKEEKQKARKDIRNARKGIPNKKDKGKGVGKGKKSKTITRVDKEQGGKKVNIKKQAVGKGKKRARKSYETESSENEDDEECMFCIKPYSRDNMGEGWVRCMNCLKWGHEACAGLDSDDCDNFTCDFCIVDRYDRTKKQLYF